MEEHRLLKAGALGSNSWRLHSPLLVSHNIKHAYSRQWHNGGLLHQHRVQFLIKNWTCEGLVASLPGLPNFYLSFMFTIHHPCTIVNANGKNRQQSLCMLYQLDVILVLKIHLALRHLITTHLIVSEWWLCLQSSLVPRPTSFFVLQFAFSIIHRSGRTQKLRKAGEHLSCEWHLVDARWT